MKRWLGVALVGTGMALAVWAWQSRQALADFPTILPAYSAKEYCSCRFVVGFDAAYCRAYVAQYLPLQRLDEDASRRWVSARGLGRERQAQWQSPREGCRLLP